MPSPIFLSNPSAGFAPMAVVKGALLALSGIYVQSQVLLGDSRFKGFALNAMMLSLLIRAMAELPRITASVISWILQVVHIDIDLSHIVTTFVHDILNLQLISSLVAYCYLHDSFEKVFLSGLKTLDKLSKGEKSYSAFLFRASAFDIDTAVPMWLPNMDMTRSQTKFMISLLRSYATISLTTTVLTILPYITSKGYLLVSLYISRSFSPLIGSQLTMVSFLLGLVVPTSLMIQMLSQFNIMVLTVRSLLTMTYFQKLRLTELKTDNWIESRMGLVTGFGLFFQVLFWKFDFMSFMILILEQLALSFFIFKTTGPVKETITEPWLLRQVYCPMIYEKLTTDDLTPGSKLLSESLKYEEPISEPQSSYTTPLSSSSNLQRYI
jgi:hypothetical protein